MFQRAYLLLFLTTMFWGGNAIAGKLAVGKVSPMLLTSMRWGLALIILVTFALPQIRRDFAKIRKHWLLLAGLGAIGFTAFNVSLYSALEYTSAINVVIEQAGMPAIIFVANFLIFRIAASTQQVVGFFLTLAGVFIVASAGSLENLLTLSFNRGDIIMLFAITFYGGYTVALRYKPQIHWQSLISVLALSAFVVSLPFSIWEYLAGNTIVPGVEGFTIAAYTAIFPAIVGQVLYIKGNELIGSNRAGLFINLVPIFGTLMAVVILREAIQLYHLLALALVVGGIGLAESNKQPTLPST